MSKNLKRKTPTRSGGDFFTPEPARSNKLKKLLKAKQESPPPTRRTSTKHVSSRVRSSRQIAEDSGSDSQEYA